MAVDAAGNVYVGDQRNNTIRRISPLGVVSVFAGSGAEGSSDGDAETASFYAATGIAFDAAGNLYVNDEGNSKVRKITPGGVVSTLAGSGEAGQVDGPGAIARFNSNSVGIVADASGNVFVGDQGSHKIRKITPDGVVSTFAGVGSFGSDDGVGTAAFFHSPAGVTLDSVGNMYVADLENNKIRKITPDAVVTTFAGSGAEGSTNATGTAASFYYPTGIAIDTFGNLYVSDQGNNKIRKITPVGVVSTFAGSGAEGSTDAVGTEASFKYPTGLAFGPNGNLYVADQGNHLIRMITPAAVVTTLAGTGSVGSDNYSRVGSVSTDDGGVTLSYRHCYRLVVTLTDWDGNSSGYMSPDVTIDKAAPTVDVACTPDAGATKAALIACTATFSGPPAAGSSFTAADLVVGGAATGWLADEPVGAGAGPYSFNVAGGSAGTLTLAIPAGAITDDDGYETAASETLAWTIDRGLPSTSGPNVAPKAATALSGASIPLYLTWSGADNAGGSGVARYELGRSVSGGAWTSVSTALTTKSTTVVAGSSGTVRYRVRAVDQAGNAGAWSYGLTLTPRLTQQTSTTVKYGGTWSTSTSSSFSAGSAKAASTAGRSASYTFTGRSIAFVGTMATSRGKVKIYINGTYVATVDCYRSTTMYRALVWQKTWSTSATRTIKLVAVGTSGRPRVDLDAFVVVK